MSAKIVIIEDNKDNLELMVYLLKQYGYTTITAMDGGEGLNLVQKEMPNLIICDMQLPTLNGYQIVKQLKCNPQLSHIPIIAVTAYSMVGDRDKILASGFDNYMSKPIEPELFVKEIENYLPKEKRQSKINFEPNQAESAGSQKSVKTTKGSILILDDSIDNRDFLDVLLQSSSFKTYVASDVTVALKFLSKNIPDLVISDLHLPMISGMEFIKQIKSHPTFQKIPVIVVTASQPTRMERKECLALGVREFIVRPIEAKDFINIINEIFNTLLLQAKGDD